MSDNYYKAQVSFTLQSGLGMQRGAFYISKKQYRNDRIVFLYLLNLSIMKQVFQLKVEINDIKPKIWRRLLVSSDTTFYQLHHILQIALGWKNYHLFQFDLNKKFIGLPDPDDSKTISAIDTSLKKMLVQGSKFEYEYDFGDYWTHSITVEDILSLNKDITYPSCFQGERNAPPEDCGGTDGYNNLLKVLKNKKSADREELIQWLGGEGAYDPEYFDLKMINKQLNGLDKYIRKFEKQA